MSCIYVLFDLSIASEQSLTHASARLRHNAASRTHVADGALGSARGVALMSEGARVAEVARHAHLWHAHKVNTREPSQHGQSPALE